MSHCNGLFQRHLHECWKQQKKTEHKKTLIRNVSGASWEEHHFWNCTTAKHFVFVWWKLVIIIPYRILILKWWLLQLILVLWLAAITKQNKNVNSLFTTTTDILTNQISPAYIFEFKNVPSSLSFCWHFLLGGRSFVFGASQSCGPPVNLLLGLKET